MNAPEHEGDKMSKPKPRDTIDLLPNPKTEEEYRTVEKHICNSRYHAGMGWHMAIACYQRLERNLGYHLQTLNKAGEDK